MKKIKIFNRRRGFIDNNQGVVIMTVIFALIVIVGGLALLFMLSQIIVPLILLIVLVVVVSVAFKFVFRVKTPKYVSRGIEEAARYGEKGARAGVSWIGRVLR